MTSEIWPQKLPSWWHSCKLHLIVPFRYAGVISGKFGWARVHILVRQLNQNTHGEIKWVWCAVPPKCTKKGRIRYLVYPNLAINLAISGQWLNITGYQNSRNGFWLANWESWFDKWMIQKLHIWITANTAVDSWGKGQPSLLGWPLLKGKVAQNRGSQKLGYEWVGPVSRSWLSCEGN